MNTFWGCKAYLTKKAEPDGHDAGKTTQNEYHQYRLNQIEQTHTLNCSRQIKTKYELTPYLTEIKDYKQRK